MKYVDSAADENIIPAPFLVLLAASIELAQHVAWGGDGGGDLTWTCDRLNDHTSSQWIMLRCCLSLAYTDKELLNCNLPQRPALLCLHAPMVGSMGLKINDT